MDIVGIYEMRRPGRDKISSRGYTCYWSIIEDGPHVSGVAVGIPSRLMQCVVEVTMVDKHIIQVTHFPSTYVLSLAIFNEI